MAEPAKTNLVQETNTPLMAHSNTILVAGLMTILATLIIPLPTYLPREVWVRYSWSRTFNRFRLFGEDFLELTMIDRDKPVYPYKPETIPLSGEGGSGKDDLK